MTEVASQPCRHKLTADIPCRLPGGHVGMHFNPVELAQGTLIEISWTSDYTKPSVRRYAQLLEGWMVDRDDMATGPMIV